MSTAIRFHFLFEQSGTFKRCAQEMGYTAFDYDIQNAFAQTDYQCDLFKEIDEAAAGNTSIFDSFTPSDIVMAFFPCVRFSGQFALCLSGNNSGFRNFSDCKKLAKSMQFHLELHRFYCLLCKLCMICLERGLRLVIENPFRDSYLLKYFPLKPAVVYTDRRRFGDYYNEPTMFFFVGWQPFDNVIFECRKMSPKKRVVDENQTTRSMISPEFAKYFIKAHLLPPSDEPYVFGFCAEHI